MPDEQNVVSRTFEEMFKHPVRYEIPFFQRTYAWNRPEWKQLDDDIEEQILKDVLERIKDKGKEVNSDILREYLYDYEHFFGAIVVLEKPNADPALKRFYVIDGQQRITTVYLLIAVVVEQLKRKSDLAEKAKEYINYLEELLTNEIDTSGDDYKKLKIFSNKGDRLPTYLMLYGQNPQSDFLSADQQLYIPDKNRIDIFRKYMQRKLQGASVEYLWAYSQAILKSLKIVWIPLKEGKDDPQAIFESLNAKGTPLSASELLCSFLFRPLIDENNNQHEIIHNEKWLKSINEVGGDKNFEAYLRNLLSIGQKKMIGKGRRVYVFFKYNNKHLTAEDAIQYLNSIKESTSLYNHITDPLTHPHPNKEIKKMLVQIDNTNMYSCTPFLLSVLRAIKNAELSEQDAVKTLKETFVLLVRRKLAKLQVTKYDTFFPGLWDKIKDEPNKVRALQEQIKKEDLWVSNQELEDSIKNKPLYAKTELSFVRLVLQEIDKQMQSHGQFPDYSTIETVEHIMPQTLNDKWVEYLGEDAQDLSLDRIKNSIGNLCLLSRPANSSEGQKLFEEKKKHPALSDVSALNRDLKSRNIKWNISAIKQRSADLAEKGLKVWKWN